MTQSELPETSLPETALPETSSTSDTAEAAEAAQPSFTEDYLLNRRVLIRQPRDGYRAGIDPVLLAATVPAQAGETVLDIGCGVGGATLCLATRVPECRVAGLEIHQDTVRMGNDNVELNGLAGRVSLVQGSLLRPPPRIAPGSYHHVMTNPPFFDARHHTAPTDPVRALAHLEDEVSLENWIQACLLMLKPKGSLSMIHRAERFDDILACLRGKAGDVRLFPLWPKPGRPAKLILVRARKQVNTPMRILAGLTIHRENGQYTPAAESILRDAAALPI